MENQPPKPTTLAEENKLLKELGTRLGFFRYYFEMLPYYNTKKETFVAVNETYYNYFKEYRYETYDSFRQQLNNNIKNL